MQYLDDTLAITDELVERRMSVNLGAITYIEVPAMTFRHCIMTSTAVSRHIWRLTAWTSTSGEVYRLQVLSWNLRIMEGNLTHLLHNYADR